MYELKKIGKVFTSKFVGTGPSSYKKRIYRAAVPRRLRNTVQCLAHYHLPRHFSIHLNRCKSPWSPGNGGSTLLQIVRAKVITHKTIIWTTEIITTIRHWNGSPLTKSFMLRVCYEAKCWCSKHVHQAQQTSHILTH